MSIPSQELLDEAAERMAFDGDFGPEMQQLADLGYTGFEIFERLTGAQQLKVYDSICARKERT